MTNELVQMAEAGRFPMISYLLGMAYAEAFDVLRGERPVRHIKLGAGQLHPGALANDSRPQPGRA
jgi:hypothetical protein